MLRGFFDRLVNRHVCVLNPASSVRGVKDQRIEGKTPEITIEHARMLLASIDTGHVVGLRDRAIHGTLPHTASRLANHSRFTQASRKALQRVRYASGHEAVVGIGALEV